MTLQIPSTFNHTQLAPLKLCNEKGVAALKATDRVPALK